MRLLLLFHHRQLPRPRARARTQPAVRPEPAPEPPPDNNCCPRDGIDARKRTRRTPCDQSGDCYDDNDATHPSTTPLSRPDAPIDLVQSAIMPAHHPGPAQPSHATLTDRCRPPPSAAKLAPCSLSSASRTRPGTWDWRRRRALGVATGRRSGSIAALVHSRCSSSRSSRWARHIRRRARLAPRPPGSTAVRPSRSWPAPSESTPPPHAFARWRPSQAHIICGVRDSVLCHAHRDVDVAGRSAGVGAHVVGQRRELVGLVGVDAGQDHLELHGKIDARLAGAQ